MFSQTIVNCKLSLLYQTAEETADILANEPNTAKIEFILQSVQALIPVEVKAGSNTKAKILQSFKQRYPPAQTIKMMGAVGVIDKKDRVLPLYYSKQLKYLLH
ncbi:MAG: hypothetical protein HRU20_28365 [Pseudomonadales bacterium]|nr:hypothetical protein [Pseudomonadales bacterium]